MIHFFCLSCWHEISERDVKCPHCNYDLDIYLNMPYEYKLIFSLNHPVKELKKLAVFIIGIKK